jgi:ribosome-associated heat shock protein Hsp15
MTGDDAEDRDWQRLDKWLWCARFLKARPDCARLAAGGLVRLNRRPIDKPHARLRAGDVLTLPLRGTVIVVEVLSLATCRGPASEARTLYREIPPGGPGAEAGLRQIPCDGDVSAAYPDL